MEIKNPRRILCLGPPDSGILSLLKDLTGSSPTPRSLPASSPQPTSTTAAPPSSPPDLAPTTTTTTTTTTTAGTSHALSLNTSYYTSTIPIWLDETSTPSTWAPDFLTPEASEVVHAIGAWLVVFRKSSLLDLRTDQAHKSTTDPRTWSRADISTTLQEIKSIIAFAHDDDVSAWDGTCLAVGMSGGSVSSLSDEVAKETIVNEAASKEEWEDECFEAGFEYVDCSSGGREDSVRNEFGELTGLARVREALEAVEWEDLAGEGGADGELSEEAGEGEDEDAGFRVERRELEREFVGLKMDMAAGVEDDGFGEGVEDDVEQLDVMLRKMLAVKDMSGHLTEVERQRMARKVVGEVMGDNAFHS